MTVRLTSSRPRRASTRLDEPTLFQFLVLSMLLHALAIVMFGAAGRIGGARSDDILGALDVTLRRLTPEPGAGFRLLPGTADAVPTPSRPPLTRPESAAKPRQKSADEAPAISAPPEPTPSATPEAAAPLSPPLAAPPESVPRLNQAAPEEMDKPLRPIERIAPPKIETSPQPLEPIVPSSIEREVSPPVEARKRAIPAAPVLPLERIAPAQRERALEKPVELAPQAVPITPTTPLERIAPAPAERELVPPVEPLREQPIAPGAPIERTVAPAIERPLAPAIEAPKRALPEAPAAPIERTAPPAIERELSPAIELPKRTLPATPGTPIEHFAPPASERPMAPATDIPAPRRVAVPETRDAVPPATTGGQAAPATPGILAPGQIERAPARPEASPPSRSGTPSPEEEIFKPRSDTAPGAAPRIDLDAAKKRAVREMARDGSGSTGVLSLPLPVPPEKKSKEAKAMEKAIKPDCRTAYAGMGLLAVPALVAAAITDEGCRW